MAHIQNSGYHPGDSILHSIGARSKILLALVCIFVTGTGGGLALLFMFFFATWECWFLEYLFWMRGNVWRR